MKRRGVNIRLGEDAKASVDVGLKGETWRQRRFETDSLCTMSK
jgi:hypothetical protein